MAATVRFSRFKCGPLCPFCERQRSRVVDSRWHESTQTKRRTRECICGERFYTEEKAINVRIRRTATG
jgi:transcriptional regulator NrdR family protein